MTEEASAPGEATQPTMDERAAVLIPLRSLHDGKLRLQAVLGDEERRALIRSMAETVVAAAHDLPVLVVYADDAVADWAIELGADAIAATEPGLNRAVEQGRSVLTRRGFGYTIVAHADLPCATDLRVVTGFDGITLVPDRIRDGTNVLCVPSGADFTFSYGPGSFASHLELAEASGYPVRVLEDERLALDVDHPDDLARLPTTGGQGS